MAVIRDFIYLDIERVRSFYAQLVGGLPTERSIQSEREHGVEGAAGVKVPFLEARFGSDHRYHRSSTETRSLHDQLLVEFMEELDERRFLSRLGQNVEWSESAFRDGMFVLAKGPMRIIDYKLIVSEIENLSHLARTIDSFEHIKEDNSNAASIQGNRKQRRKAQKNKRANSESSLEGKMEQAAVPQIASFLDHHMRDTMRVLVYPIPNCPEKHFVASARISALRYNTSTLQGLYGHTIDADWQCLLQVNIGQQCEMFVHSQDSHTAAGGIETALESVIEGLANINAMKQGIHFPRVAATPIAIYREIPVRENPH